MMDQKIYPVDGMKPHIMRTNQAAKLKTHKMKTKEQALDQEEPNSDKDLDVKNDNDSELISSEDDGDADIKNDDSELISRMAEKMMMTMMRQGLMTLRMNGFAQEKIENIW